MKRYTVRATREPVLDFARAEALTEFSFPWQGGTPPQTELRALWTPQALHFRFDCVDDDLVLARGATLRERVVGSDRVELFLTPSLELDPYYCLELEPRGEVLAYRARAYRNFDWEWRCAGLSTHARITECGYTVSGSVPLATLRELSLLKAGARELLIGAYRAEFSQRPDGSVHFGWMPWVNPGTAKPDFHVPESFGRFELEGYSFSP